MAQELNIDNFIPLQTSLHDFFKMWLTYIKPLHIEEF